MEAQLFHALCVCLCVGTNADLLARNNSPFDGCNQTLLQLPGDWRESATDGAVRKQSIHWYARRISHNLIQWFPFELHVEMLLPGTLFRASQFLSEELPIRLAHRVQELGDLPDGLNEMESITRVQDWYAQSFEVSQNSGNAYWRGKVVLIDFQIGNHHPAEAESQFRHQRTPDKTRQGKWQKRSHPEYAHRKSKRGARTVQIGCPGPEAR